jgi:transcription termination/antitermination protein NusG
MQWYVVHTLTGKESKVKAAIEKMAEARDLRVFLGRVLVPTETEIRSSAGKRREIKRKLYPGYVLVEMDMNDEIRHLIQNTSGVTKFVSASDTPVPLPESDVARIMEAVGEEGKRPKAIWQTGQSVRIIEGPFNEFTGKITDVNAERETVKVSVSIFGRETPVEVDFTQIERL